MGTRGKYPIEEPHWSVAVGITLLLILLITPVLGFCYWCEFAPAVSEAKAHAIYPNMSQEELRELLGDPQDIGPMNGGWQTWRYGRPWQQRYFTVTFHDGRVGFIGDE